MKLPPLMAIRDQHLMADRLYEHMLREGVKAKDDVVLVPVGVSLSECSATQGQRTACRPFPSERLYA